MDGEQPLDGTFLLPGGLMVGENRRLSEVELRPLTGYEEEWLAQHPRTPSAQVVTRLLSACLVRVGDTAPSRDLVRHLLVGDRDYLILQLRRLTLGDEFQAVIICPACEAKMDVTVQASDIPVDQRPQAVACYTLELPTPEHPARTVRFRLPTGADQEAVLGMNRPAAVDALLKRCILDDAEVPLSPEERQAVVDAMDRLAPQLEVELDLTCPECARAFLAPFDPTTFFFQEMRINGDQLLREIHLLAFYYHWSEAEILSLRRDRRRAYLSLLRDALRQD
jgi:hypothetical protein